MRKMEKLDLTIVVVLVISMLASTLAGCGQAANTAPAGLGNAAAVSEPIELRVVTPFSDSDGNRSNYLKAYKAYEAASGNIINDVETSAVDEKWKLGVLSDFKNGNRPDVINFFTGADANELIANNELVSISEIRNIYPDYAANMKESLIPVSPYDGRQYAVTVYGYWEGLFVNKKVLKDCGIAIPAADYTWDQFIADCKVLKKKGYTPIAASLSQIPHYWFEYCVFNNGSAADHPKPPTSADSTVGQSWVAGLDDIKGLYELGFFPEDTNKVDDDTTSMMFVDNKAAFLVDGSWKVGWLQDTVKKSKSVNLDNFLVTYFPSNGIRKSTDAVGGFSMGYYITRQAWDNPAKRQACVDFVMAMTTDEVVSTFGELTVTALKNGVIPSGKKLSLLAQSALAMTKGCTAIVPAAQDTISPAARANLFENVSKVVEGKLSARQSLVDCLAIEAKTATSGAD